jgi:hypothetical protein
VLIDVGLMVIVVVLVVTVVVDVVKVLFGKVDVVGEVEEFCVVLL